MELLIKYFTFKLDTKVSEKKSFLWKRNYLCISYILATVGVKKVTKRDYTGKKSKATANPKKKMSHVKMLVSLPTEQCCLQSLFKCI